MAAPTKFNEKDVEQILELISTTNRGNKSICDELEIKISTFYMWLSDETKKVGGIKFSDLYARAKQSQAHLLVEEMLSIADDSTGDTATIWKDGKQIKIEDKEWTNRTRMRLDTRKFIAMKLLPKVYGDRIQVDQTITEQPLFTDPKDE